MILYFRLKIEGRDEMAEITERVIVSEFWSELKSLRYDLNIALKYVKDRDRDGKLAELCSRVPNYIRDTMRWANMFDLSIDDDITGQVRYFKDLFGEPTVEVLDIVARGGFNAEKLLVFFTSLIEKSDEIISFLKDEMDGKNL